MNAMERVGIRAGPTEAYRTLPSLYLGFLAIWIFSAFSWTINTWSNRHYRTNTLQWTLASVPMIKILQLGFSFVFWYSCFNLQICSLWMSFGVYITGVLFQTASFVSFLLISHGYSIMCEQLSAPERRSTTALGCIFYLILVGYRASVPYFAGLLLLNYFVSFYVIFSHISQNLLLLRRQLSFIEVESIQRMHDAVHSKYTMFKKFRGAMQIVAVTELVIYMNMDNASDSYWLRLLVRECIQFGIFLYIGWTFRSQELSPSFSIIPSVKSIGESLVPPIYRIELDYKDFKDFSSHEWHIGVPTLKQLKSSRDPLLVIVEHPHSYRSSSGSTARDNHPANTTTATLTSASKTNIGFFSRTNDHEL
ncbi:hypothetical protein Syun_026264 [Stephania yunnanensis]|uniref:Uncharacterized protein n=1 Tax=Stephania yunnanensis TaxID=152371 RepID=A0AAP0F230_9MAGN